MQCLHVCKLYLIATILTPLHFKPALAGVDLRTILRFLPKLLGRIQCSWRKVSIQLQKKEIIN